MKLIASLPVPGGHLKRFVAFLFPTTFCTVENQPFLTSAEYGVRISSWVFHITLLFIPTLWDSFYFSAFLCFFLMAIVWWVVLGSVYHMWNSPDIFLRNCSLARLCPPGPGHSFLSVRLLTSSSCIKCLIFQSTFYLYFLFIIYSPQKSSLSQFHVFMQKKHLISVPIHLVQTLPRMFLAQARGLRPDISSCSWLPYFLGTHRPFPMIWHLYIQSCDGGKTLSKDGSWKEPDWQ